MKYYFEEEINRFIDYVNSLESTLPLLMIILSATTKVAEDKFNKFIEENEITKVEESSKKSKYQLTFDQLSQFRKLSDDFTNSIISYNIVPRNFIISMVSQYDAFVGRLIKILFYTKPEILNSSEKNLTFSQIVEFVTLDDAKEYIIEKEVEGVLRKSHEDQFKWLENKLGIPLRKDLNIWPTFIELTERRNLFVHCNGEISSQYISVCKDNQVVLDGSCKIGETLEVSNEYFDKAYRCIFEIGVKLAHVFWRKISPDEREQADLNINNVCYNLIESRKYDLAIILLEFATNFKHFSSEEIRLMLNINKAQAYKWAGNEKECRNILDNFDWSAYSLDFKLAKSVLIEDYDNACLLMKRIGTIGDFKKSNYRDWPLFKKFRNTQQFLNTYQELYGEDFKLVVEEEKNEIKKKIEMKEQIAHLDNPQVEAASTHSEE